MCEARRPFNAKKTHSDKKFLFTFRLSCPLCCGVKLLVEFPHSHTNYYEIYEAQWSSVELQQKESFTILLRLRFINLLFELIVAKL